MTQLSGFPYRVQENSTAGFGGTGDVQLDGVPTTPLGRVNFSDGVGNGLVVRFLIDDGAGNWEVSEGVVDDTGSPHTISRDTVLKSSAADAKVNFSAGVKDIVGIYVPTGWELIEKLTASASAALDFDNGVSSSFDAFKLVLTNILPASDGDNLLVRVSEDAGSTWKSGASDYEYSLMAHNSSGTSFTDQGSSQGATSMLVTNSQGFTAGEGANGEIRFFGPAASANHNFISDLSYWDNTATAIGYRAHGFGAYNGTMNAIDGVRLLFASGNIASGSAALYGLRK